TVSITVTNVNDAPVANNDSAAANEDSADNFIDVLANDTDNDNLPPIAANAGLIVIGVGPASHGAAAFTSSGVTYTPAANYYGSDTFSYTITDPTGLTSTATVNVTVTNVNDPPVANNDAATVAEDSLSNAIDVLANDTDLDNLAGPANAGLTITAIGS